MSSDASRVAGLKLALTLVALAAVAVGGWYTRRSWQPRRVTAPKAPPVPKFTTTALDHRDLELSPLDAQHEPEPEPIALPPLSRADLPESSAPPLEDMIEKALPAVVMIETPKSRGSGFFIKPDLVATNAHVVAGFLFAAVTTRDGVRLNGKVAQLSDQYDLALIQVLRFGPTDAQLPLGDSGGLRLGQGVVALGWAVSLTQSTVTRGILTGVRLDHDRSLLQTDAVPNPGDSGGPLLNRSGEVIGINSGRVEGGSATSGYAVAIDDVKPFVAKVMQNVFTVPVSPRAADAVALGRTSDAESRRNVGLQRYAGALKGIENNVAELDSMWTRYKAACQITLVPPGQTHEWFNLYDPKSPVQQTPPWCSDILRDLKRRAQVVSQTMTAAAEAAREADVYPGTLRAMRARFRLDYSGWDN